VSTLPEVSEIRRWNIQPGDRLIIHCEQRITSAQGEAIRDRVRVFLQLPDDFPLVVIDGGLTVEVASGP
jgi:hypothetical protein